MHQNPIKFFAPRMILFLLTAIFALSCTSLKSNMKNYEGERNSSQIGIIKQRGYLFWLHGGPETPVDELWLTPGQYMIRFQSSTGRSGFGLCGIDPGKFYGFRVTGRQYMPAAGVYALKGYCTDDEEEPLTDAYIQEWKKAHEEEN